MLLGRAKLQRGVAGKEFWQCRVRLVLRQVKMIILLREDCEEVQARYRITSSELDVPQVKLEVVKIALCR